MARAFPLSALAATLLLAGCAGSGSPGPDSTGAGSEEAGDGGDTPLTILETEEGYRLSRPLEQTDVLEAPLPWRVGDWYGVHVFFGSNDTEGIHYNTVVVDETADEWMLATDNTQAAKEEAVFDLPILGPFRKNDLGTSGLGGRWDLLQFPLQDGASWSRPVGLDFGVSLDLEFQATYQESLPTPYGTFAGFDVLAVDAEARPVLQFDYVPDIGWFTTFTFFDVSTEDPADAVVRARSMGHGSGWTGTYYVDTAESLAEHFSLLVLDPADPQAQPAAPSTFTVDEGATYLVGFAFSFAFGGVHETYLVGPDNQAREFRAVGTGVHDEAAEAFIDEPALPGEWRIVTAGAGLAAGGGVFLWQVTETSAAL